MAGLEALTESLDHCETPSCSSQLHSDSEVQDANSVPDQPMAHASDSASIGTALKQQPISIAEPAGKAPSLPKLHSNPGATKRIYLDFDGHTTTGTLWNNWVGGSPIVSPPYSLDSVQSTNFTAVELDKIQEIYQRVAEDFLPFDVDVTTEEPPIGALLKSGSGDQEWGIRVVIGGDNRDWFNPNGKGYIGGVAYGGSFNWSTDTPTFVWSEDVRPGWRGDAYHIAAKVSHEVGHTLGLGHQKVSGGGNYCGHGTGPTSWGPLMGCAGGQVTQWSKGEFKGSLNPQDELAIITSGANGFGYRVDDHVNTAGNATVVTVDSGFRFSSEGIIEQSSDFDVFAIPTAGKIEIAVQPADVGPNLDILAEIFDLNGQLIATSNPVNALDASFSLTVAPGMYYLRISGTGKGDPLTDGYSDYASLGYYSIKGELSSDILIHSVTADGHATATVSYEIVGAGVPQFEIGFYRSKDASFDGSDTQLYSANAIHLTHGTHTQYFTIGGGQGEVALPGAGLPDSSGCGDEHYILGVVDHSNVVSNERDAQRHTARGPRL